MPFGISLWEIMVFVGILLFIFYLAISITKKNNKLDSMIYDLREIQSNSVTGVVSAGALDEVLKELVSDGEAPEGLLANSESLIDWWQSLNPSIQKDIVRKINKISIPQEKVTPETTEYGIDEEDTEELKVIFCPRCGAENNVEEPYDDDEIMICEECGERISVRPAEVSISDDKEINTDIAAAMGKNKLTPVVVPDTTSQPKTGNNNQFALTINVNGEGSTAPGVGIHLFKKNTVVNVSVHLAKGWKFTGWIGDVVEPYQHFTTIRMDSDKTLTATFKEIGTSHVPEPSPLPVTKQRVLTLSVNGKGITNPRQGSHHFIEGTNVNIVASPSDGWEFIGWVGNVDEPYADNTTLIMDIDKNVVANFIKI